MTCLPSVSQANEKQLLPQRGMAHSFPLPRLSSCTPGQFITLVMPYWKILVLFQVAGVNLSLPQIYFEERRLLILEIQGLFTIQMKEVQVIRHHHLLN